MMRRTWLSGTAIATAAGVLWLSGATLPAAGDDGVLRGIVRSDAGPEAGVWVIAATSDLETVYRKIVVTGDDGRFLVPDLPDANYEVWSRGYGLMDSTRVAVRPGDDVELAPAVATDPRDAAAIYPANYWYALLEVPEAGDFPGTGPRGNGISRQMRNQAEWVDRLKDGCQLCHQMGNLATREVPNLDDYDSTLHAWEQRVLIGATGAGMNAGIDRMGRERSLQAFASWTDRILAGDVPPAPPRPAGAERNVVLTQWGWSSERGFIHDEITTDKRNPTVNANGPVYGVDMLGKLAVADPVRHLAFELDIPTRVPMDRRGTGYGAPTVAPVPSPYWGDEVVERTGPANPHNPMMDAQGRVWMTSTIRPRENPSWCQESDHPSVQRFPLQRAGRQMSYYDPEQQEFVLIDTCFDTHHLQFAEDADDTLWISGDGNVVGWINTRLYDETGNEQASQGWCPTIVDTNGDGRAGAYVDPGEAPDPAKDTRINGFAYGIIPNPVDGSVWVARPYPNPVPGQLVRLDPDTCLAEVYEPPFETDAVPPEQWGHGPRGIDVDRNGVIWTALGGSGHLASFDRSRCAVLNGPDATGQHCPEGWTLYPTPGPQMAGVSAAGSADFHYYMWVDQFDTLGLGTNVPLVNGTTSDSLIALLPETGEMLTLRVPYPLGFYTRGLDGRIDDPEAGWKGRGVWASNDTIANWHNEGGKGMTSEIVRFQVRPHPLAP
ncbi:MAG: carboxypeptidase regulatory-like domain-containing protein [Acidobacteria bacterium]|nr:carboxypeptidase regulatory-like domain-containing protein [Acidobacteriota bacterium]